MNDEHKQDNPDPDDKLSIKEQLDALNAAAKPDRSDDDFRVKDQFGSVETIMPHASAPAKKPSPPLRPAMPLSSEGGEKKKASSIRKPTDFQDFFINLDFIKILRGIYRRSWVIALCAIGMLLLTLPIGMKMQSQTNFSAQATIIYTRTRSKQIDTEGSSFILNSLSQETLVDMLISPETINALEEYTGLDDLDKSIGIESQSKSDLIVLTVEGMADERTAIGTVNELANLIIESNERFYKRQAETAYQQYRKERAEAKEQLESAVQAVQDFQLKNGVLDLSTLYKSHFDSENSARERLNVARVAHEGLIVRIKNYERMITELPDEVLDESLENNPLKRKISNAEGALLQARIQLAADNPKIQKQERELEELRELLRSGSFDETRERTYIENPLKEQLKGELLKLQSEEEVARNQIVALEKNLEAIKANFQNLPQMEKEYASLLQERSNADARYNILKASEESARLTTEAKLTDFNLYSPATEAEDEGGSLLGKIVPIAGFIFGFGSGLFLLILLELLDAKIRTRQQLDNGFNAPCLASIVDIPHLGELEDYDILLPSLREISERIQVLLQKEHTKIFGLMSALDREGKSLLSFNLARYYRSLNINVLYVSLDDTPNEFLPAASDVGWPQKGIEEYLKAPIELSEMVTTVKGVDTIQVHRAGADFLDLTKSTAMTRLWDLLRANYDLILTDLPAILDNPVSGTLAGHMDELIYVIASPVSDRKMVDAALEFLEDRDEVPGALIFNRVDPYYLDDVRQQRIIQNLSSQQTFWQKLVDVKTRLTVSAKHLVDLVNKIKNDPNKKPPMDS